MMHVKYVLFQIYFYSKTLSVNVKYLSRDLKANVNILLNLIVPGNWRCHAMYRQKSSFLAHSLRHMTQ